MQLRVDRARELLLYSERAVIEVAISTGFTSTSHLATWYKRIYGIRPSDMRGRSSPSLNCDEEERSRKRA
jgi:transcriptional regulator GlxA family with amidase domain